MVDPNWPPPWIRAWIPPFNFYLYLTDTFSKMRALDIFKHISVYCYYWFSHWSFCKYWSNLFIYVLCFINYFIYLPSFNRKAVTSLQSWFIYSVHSYTQKIYNDQSILIHRTIIGPIHSYTQDYNRTNPFLYTGLY